MRVNCNAAMRNVTDCLRGFPKGPQPLGTLTLLARSSVLYLCEGDGADRRFRILSPRCLPAYPSPQQRDALEFLKQRAETFVSAVVHLDEKTPHMHVTFVPLTEDNRLSAKEIIGNKAKLSQWQSDYWTHMVGKYPDLERSESADKTDRKHIPPRVFKEMTHLAKQSRKIEAVMDDANVFNAKGKLQEVEALLERFIPSVERMQTQLDQYKVAFTDTTTENASLKKEVAELQSKLDTAKRESVQKKLDDAQLLSDYRELRRIVERIPPEILERAKRQERSTAASRCTR